MSSNKKISSAGKFKIESFDDLFGTGGTQAPESVPDGQVVEVPLDDLHEFNGHPFLVQDDEKMQETVESIQEHGVLMPGIVRPRKEGGYEIIAGHRRKRGSQLAGKTTMPVFIREYSDDEATVIMVDTNIQREGILPSEKAFAYKMKMEALKHQGKKNEDDAGSSTAELVGKKAGDSGRTVQRFIRLTELVPKLLEMVDRGSLKMIPAVNLSYLSQEEQIWILECMEENGGSVSKETAETLKKYSSEGCLTKELLETVMCREKSKTEKITIPEHKIRDYFPEEYCMADMEQVIYDLLEEWKNRNQ